MRPVLSNMAPADTAQIESLLCDAFGGRDEVDLMARLRNPELKIIEICAHHGTELVGHIFLSEMILPKKWGALAPLSVASAHQKKGVGTTLVEEAIRRAKAHGWEALVVLGDPKYYGRFGFSTERAEGFTSPYPIKFTGILPFENVKMPVNGVLIYPSEFEGV